MRFIRNGLRLTAVAVLLLVVFVIGIEAGWLTPLLFKKQVNFVCDTLTGTHCEKFNIESVRGGTVWPVSVLGLDFSWAEEKRKITLFVPYLKTNFFWKDIIPIIREKKVFPLNVALFHPLFVLNVEEKGAKDSLLKGLLLPFYKDADIPFQNMVKGIPFDLFQFNVIDGHVDLCHDDKSFELTKVNCFYTKMNETKTSAYKKESCSFKAKLQEKDIFLSLIMEKGRKDIYAILKEILMGKDLVVNIRHEDRNDMSEVMFFAQDLFLLSGILRYVNKNTFQSYGEILPENILWKKAEENKWLWRILKKIDPYDYESTFMLSGGDGGGRLRLSFHEKLGKEYFISNFFMNSTDAVHFDLDISGLIKAEGSYDLLKSEIQLKLDFKKMQLRKLLELCGIEREKEIKGEAHGKIHLEGPLGNLTINGLIESGEGTIDSFSFKKAVIKVSGTGRFIFLENSRFIRERGEIPIVGYFDLGLNNPLRNIKVKPKNSLVWSGIDILRDDDSFSLEKELSDRVKVQLLRKLGDDPESIRKDDFGVKLELDLDDMHKFLYKRDEEDSFIGLERKIKF